MDMHNVAREELNDYYGICPTCHGTHQIQVPDPRDSAWLPLKPITRPCPDCTQEKSA